MQLKTILLATAAAMAFADCAAAQGADVSTTTVDEVVVTAQKRTENIQTVPIAVTVIGAERLTNANVSGFSDLTKFTPAMTISAGDQPANSSIVVRGVGTFAFSIAVEPSVLVVVDDVAAGYQAQAFTDLVDIDRVEVLEGPQSTLYGKSASAGLVAVTTKAPSSTFTAYGDLKVTNDHEQRVSMSVSGPVSDTLGFRLSAAERSWDGNVENLATHSKIDGDRSASIRGKLEWKPTGNFDATFTAHFNKDDATCCAQPLVQLDPGALLFGKAGYTPAVAIPGITPGANNKTVNLDVPPRANAEDYGATAHLAYDFGHNTLLSITGVNKYTLHDLTDWDTTAVDILDAFTPHTNTNPAGSSPPTTPTQLDGGFAQGGQFKVRTFTQEFRLVSDGTRDFNYVLGAYYSNEDLVRNFGRGGILGTTSTPGGKGQIVTNLPINSGPPNGPFLDNSKAVANWRGETKYQNYALFGQTTWKIFDKTSLITGLRFNRENSTYSYDDYYRVIHFPLLAEPQRNTDDVVTGKIGLQYQATDDVMAFATVSRGYKGVAYDLVTGLSAAEAATFPVKPETSLDYEVGLRTQSADHRFVLNGTIYDTEYTNFQIQTILPNLLNTFVLANIPKARTRGFELEGSARLTDDFSMNAGYAYTDAVAVSYPLGQCYSGQQSPTTCTTAFLPPPNGSAHGQNLSGATLPNAPKNKFNLGADYRMHFPNMPFYGDLSATYVWQSQINYAITHDPGTVQGAYGLMNLNLSFIEQQNKRYTLSFFVNNLFNEHYASNRGNVRGNWFTGSGPAEAYAQEIPRDYDRYFGLRLAFSY